MGIETVASAALYVTTTLPATDTLSGFTALTGWVKVGEITDMGSIKGRAYNTSTHAPVDSAQQIEKKASYKLPPADFTVGWDDEDDGQVIIEAASNTNEILSFKLVKQGGAKRYCTAQVKEFIENLGTVDNVVQGKFTLLRQTDTISD